MVPARIIGNPALKAAASRSCGLPGPSPPIRASRALSDAAGIRAYFNGKKKSVNSSSGLFLPLSWMRDHASGTLSVTTPSASL